MSTVVVWILTALAAAVVVLTRLRMRGGQASGQVRIGDRLPLVHTVVGGLAVVTWVLYLLLGGALIGILALAAWWVVAVVGVLLLMRWLPARGRRASGVVHDTWSQGPGLSLLAHGGMVVGVLVFTLAYATSAV